MQIHELAALGRTPTTGDSLAIDTGSATAKIDYDALVTAILDKIGAGSDGVVDITHGGTNATTAAAALAALGGVAVTDIVNDLTSTSTDKPLSAAQGKVLNETIDVLLNLGKREDMISSLSITGGTLSSAYKAQINKIVSIGVTFVITNSSGSGVKISGLPAPYTNRHVAYAYNNTEATIVPIMIDAAGGLSIVNNSDVSANDSLRIITTYLMA